MLLQHEMLPAQSMLDGYTASHRAVRLLGQEDARWQSVKVRNSRYLNNIVEQDHRAIKRRCASMPGFKTFRMADLTLSGIELAHRIRKRQFWVDLREQGRGQLERPESHEHELCDVLQRSELSVHPFDQTRSKIAAIPCPPPIHIVASA